MGSGQPCRNARPCGMQLQTKLYLLATFGGGSCLDVMGLPGGNASGDQLPKVGGSHAVSLPSPLAALGSTFAPKGWGPSCDTASGCRIPASDHCLCGEVQQRRCGPQPDGTCCFVRPLLSFKGNAKGKAILKLHHFWLFDQQEVGVSSRLRIASIALNGSMAFAPSGSCPNMSELKANWTMSI